MPKPTFLLNHCNNFLSEMGLLSDHTLLDFGMASLTAVLIAVTIKSVYLLRSLVDVSPVKSTEPTAALNTFDSNTSLPVWSNLYLVWLIDKFLCDGTLIETLMGSDRCPSRHLFEIGCHVLLGLVV